MGKEVIKNKIKELSNIIIFSESNYFKANYITNPILKTFHKFSTIDGKNISFDISNISYDIDLFYFLFTSQLIHFLGDELNSNENYKDEVKKSMLSSQGGVYYKKFHELLVGGYLKYKNLLVNFSASQDKGEPDVIARGEKKFLNEAKLFDDQQFRLVEKINELNEEIISFLKKIHNHEVMLFISDLDENFKKDFLTICRQYTADHKEHKVNNLLLMPTPSFYIGNEGYLVDYIPNNSRIRLKPNFDMVVSMNKLGQSIKKAERQFKGEDGVVWITFPHPKEFSMELTLLLHVSDIPKSLTINRPQLAIYEFFPQVNTSATELKTRLTILNEKKEFQFINQSDFYKFIEKIFKSPVFLVP